MEDIIDVLEEGGWVFCVDCRTAILFGDMLEGHQRHRIVKNLYNDIIATEESPAAD
jgi:uncharacterized protein YuzB (UPF0349 family)